MMTDRGLLPVIDVIRRMKECLGVETDSELADTLGLKRQTVSAWKKRGQVPTDQVVAVATRSGITIEYLLYDAGSKGLIPSSGPDHPASYAAALHVYCQCKDSVRFGDHVTTAMWWGNNFPLLVSYCEFEIQTLAIAEDISAEEGFIKFSNAVSAMTATEALTLLDAGTHGVLRQAVKQRTADAAGRRKVS